MKEKMFDFEEVFADYKVNYVKEVEEWHYGKITDVQIITNEYLNSGVRIPQYDMVIKVAVELDCEIVIQKKLFKNITLKGRRVFQEFIEQFKIVRKNTKGISVLYPEKLIGKFCKVILLRTKNIAKIKPAEFKNNNAKRIYSEFFANEAVSEFDRENMPELVKFYTIIPAYRPYNKFIVSQEYHAVIAKVEVKQDQFDYKEYMLIVTLNVFNGGNGRIFRKYFNSIFSKGKKKLDKFFIDFDIVNEEGYPDINRLKEKICKITLLENSCGNIYADELAPLNVIGKNAKKQYQQLNQYSGLCEEEF